MMVKRPNAVGFWVALLSYRGSVVQSRAPSSKVKVTASSVTAEIRQNTQGCWVV